MYWGWRERSTFPSSSGTRICAPCRAVGVISMCTFAVIYGTVLGGRIEYSRYYLANDSKIRHRLRRIGLVIFKHLEPQINLSNIHCDYIPTTA